VCGLIEVVESSWVHCCGIYIDVGGENCRVRRRCAEKLVFVGRVVV